MKHNVAVFIVLLLISASVSAQQGVSQLTYHRLIKEGQIFACKTVGTLVSGTSDGIESAVFTGTDLYGPATIEPTYPGGYVMNNLCQVELLTINGVVVDFEFTVETRELPEVPEDFVQFQPSTLLSGTLVQVPDESIGAVTFDPDREQDILFALEQHGDSGHCVELQFGTQVILDSDNCKVLVARGAIRLQYNTELEIYINSSGEASVSGTSGEFLLFSQPVVGMSEEFRSMPAYMGLPYTFSMEKEAQFSYPMNGIYWSLTECSDSFHNLGLIIDLKTRSYGLLIGTATHEVTCGMNTGSF
jgi:hypothetical protein